MDSQRFSSSHPSANLAAKRPSIVVGDCGLKRGVLRDRSAPISIADDGRAAGSISGGCIEDDLMLLCARGMPTKGWDLYLWFNGRREPRRLGLPIRRQLFMQLINLRQWLEADTLDDV
jgi:xanthine dehydrogenase accessory factor